MPIRVTDDNSAENNGGLENDQNSDKGNRGRGGMGGFLPIILNLLFKNPKIGFPLLVIFGLFFFLSKGCGSLLNSEPQKGSYSTGCEMKQEVYAQSDQFASLAENYNPLPESFSLEKFCPPIGNQGSQGSCVAWSSSYAARSILYNIATGSNPKNTVFSPSFLYNQIGLEGCQGAYIHNAMQVLEQVGDISINDFPYDENDCTRKPGQTMLQSAAAYKIKGSNRLSKDANKYEVDLLAIKQNIAQYAPVVIGMSVGGSFMEMMGQEMWIPTEEDYQKYGFGGHAMCVVGYDDFKEYNGKKVGAFQIMNSWGPEYGKNGFIWVPYQVFQEFVSEAYGLYPMGKANQEINSKLKLDFGLVVNNTDEEIKLKKTGDYTYSTSAKVQPGTKFKIKLKNSAECYSYVFAQETDGSSYTIFPYTKKHSPYCGITGTRVFPKDKFFEPDNIGNKDYFAIVVSSKPINFAEINSVLSKERIGTYEQKIVKVLGESLCKETKFISSEGISLEADLENQKLTFVVVEVNK
ncbi:MAG: C1 family peptidase [Cytophagales bacterium]